MMSPTTSSGQLTVSLTIGSSRTGEASSIAWRKAIEPAILNAISEESTSWCLPSRSVTRTPLTGKPATVPCSIASTTPFSTAGMKLPGIEAPLILLTNSSPTPSSAGSISILQSANWPRPPDCFL